MRTDGDWPRLGKMAKKVALNQSPNNFNQLVRSYSNLLQHTFVIVFRRLKKKTLPTHCGGAVAEALCC